MRLQQYRQSSTQLKGKGREIDHTDVLAQLNKLLELLLIPISLPELSVATPSLLLAVLESILERRFLALNDLSRTSKSPNSRSKCLKVMIKVLAQTLQLDVDRGSLNSIDFPGLIQGDINQMVKLIEGLLKLSRQSNNSTLFNHKRTNHQGITCKQLNEKRSCEGATLNEKRSCEGATFENTQPGSERVRTVRNDRPSEIASLYSSSSSLSIEPNKIPFDGLFSPVGPPLDQSSLILPPSASPTTSSNVRLSRSLNSQRNNEDRPSGQMSNPPTLRNLLGPLHAQMISLKRPHTPRTAHRFMVNKLRTEGAQEDTEEHTLNHDTDGSMSAKTETDENEVGLVEDLRHHSNKGLSMMTLDGIEADDPFVSMETRRALESQILQNQTNMSFDLTRLAVAGSESFHTSSQSVKKAQFQSCPLEWRQASDSMKHAWSTSSSSAISAHSFNSYELASNPDGSWGQSSQEHHRHHHQDQSYAQSTGPPPKAGERVSGHFFGFDGFVGSRFTDDYIIGHADCGFGPPIDSMKMRSRDHSLQVPHPTSIPLPVSPTESHISSSHHKVLLASEGVKLEFVISDVTTYEQQKHKKLDVEGWEWMDLSQLAQESEKLQQLGSVVTTTPTNLHSRKLELLKLVTQAYNHNHSYDRSDRPSIQRIETRENEPNICPPDKQADKVRIRVTRQPIHAGIINHFDRPANEFIVLNKPRFVRSTDLSSPADHTIRRDFSFEYDTIDPENDQYLDNQADLMDDVI